MRQNRLVLLFGILFLLAGMNGTACVPVATPAYLPTPTPTPTPTPLQAAVETSNNLAPYLAPILSILLAFSLAGYLSRRARVSTEKKLPPKFDSLEKEALELRKKLKQGEMTEDDYRKQMIEKMVQDEAGNWWVVGKEVGGWYRHTGKEWVKDAPPLLQARPLSPITQKPWMVGVIMAGLHVAIIITAVVSLVIVFIAPRDFLSGFFSYILMALLYVIMAVIILFLSRGIWSSKRGDWIVLGFSLTVALTAVMAALGFGGELFGLIINLLIITGTIVTMVLTRKAWI